jgi:hypothetical protein
MGEHQLGDVSLFRFTDGGCSYIEGIVRGYRNSLLTTPAYSNLTQCETIDGMYELLTG